MTKYDSSASESERLPNKIGLKDTQRISRLETAGFTLAESHLLANLKPNTVFDSSYICGIHLLALGQLYDFAGFYRTVNLSKGGFIFPAAHLLPSIMHKFEQSMLLQFKNSNKFNNLMRQIACIHAELLFIHPFREGNGRTARILANLMSKQSGLKGFDFSLLLNSEENQGRYIRAVQSAASQNYQPMISLLDSCSLPVD